ncbi:MAG: adenylate kinase [Cyanobacteria bacterium SIG30]|nr:adenylate kinase [Cyanobacteria bacterium SIG30]
MKNVFIFLGPPGSGKGTQTSRLAKELNFPHIDTGSLLRQNIKQQTPYGVEAKKYMDKGQLVPIEIVQNIIFERLKQEDAKNGYILDGYPRSIEQAYALEKIHDNLKEYWNDEGANVVAVYFDVPNEKLVERLVNRRSCPACGEIYNLLNKKPKNENLCDKCSVELIQRSDDNEETAKLRFETYNKETKPLLQYFEDKGNLKTINADQEIEEVWVELLKVVK